MSCIASATFVTSAAARRAGSASSTFAGRPCALRAAAPKLTTARRGLVVRMAETEESADEIVADDKAWATSYSHVYEDIVENLRPLLFLPEADPDKKISDVMSSTLITTTGDCVLSSLTEYFETITGMPVMDANGVPIGIISKKDLGDDLTKTVADVMSSPAIVISSANKVADAAALMLKHKIHRIPVMVDGKCAGMVTRKDIFTAMGQDV